MSETLAPHGPEKKHAESPPRWAQWIVASLVGAGGGSVSSTWARDDSVRARIDGLAERQAELRAEVAGLRRDVERILGR